MDKKGETRIHDFYMVINMGIRGPDLDGGPDQIVVIVQESNIVRNKYLFDNNINLRHAGIRNSLKVHV
jgi:hypothetical protein